MNHFFIGLLAITVTIVVFFFSKWLNKKFPSPFTLPVLISTLIVMFGLLLFHISYETYNIGGQWIDRFLGPAVVALAYPLYKQRQMMKNYLIPILVGVFIGSVIGVTSGLMMGKWFHIKREIILSLLPKSVTTPVAMDIANTLDGSTSLAAVLVMFAGIGGAVIGPTLFKWLKIDHDLARGLGIGSASHAIGTAKIMEESENAGAASTLAMILSAVIVSIITPLIVIWFM
ncbi:LrgB family protein [Bacillus sp. FJAT-50079]|uniref:LrgB family protein n=1 Tax=Bacillus sp. FJAT-50079 TaxID=2833577 RepID=UPI001BCA4B97|nr:LrgB family protein [Bacillus sp. FJAT-50079]MBS4210396.1 LrgB family protein [Bacillus sp. FJAT-50079]